MQREDSLESSGLTTGRQFDDALRVAENFLQQADCARAKAGRVLAAEAGVIAIAAALIVIVFGLTTSVIRPVISLIVLTLPGVLTAATMHVALRAPFRIQAERDSQAAIDIISLLREVLPLVADVENWNDTEVRLADARLSRFSIGTGGISDE